MRIKHNFIKIIIKQPERRFNENSNRKKVADIISDLSSGNILLSDVIKEAWLKHSIESKVVLAIISKLKQSKFIELETIHMSELTGGQA
tara:strand:+ start:219 stop:485 length:267 start_codon:yes stop_codon:yes gene_type:complete